MPSWHPLFSDRDRGVVTGSQGTVGCSGLPHRHCPPPHSLQGSFPPHHCPQNGRQSRGNLGLDVQQGLAQRPGEPGEGLVGSWDLTELRPKGSPEVGRTGLPPTLALGWVKCCCLTRFSHWVGQLLRTELIPPLPPYPTVYPGEVIAGLRPLPCILSYMCSPPHMPAHLPPKAGGPHPP